MDSGERRSRFAGLLALLIAALCLLPGTALAQGQGHEVGVMTRNLYLGADLSPAINAATSTTAPKKPRPETRNRSLIARSKEHGRGGGCPPEGGFSSPCRSDTGGNGA